MLQEGNIKKKKKKGIWWTKEAKTCGQTSWHRRIPGYYTIWGCTLSHSLSLSCYMYIFIVITICSFLFMFLVFFFWSLCPTINKIKIKNKKDQRRENLSLEWHNVDITWCCWSHESEQLSCAEPTWKRSWSSGNKYIPVYIYRVRIYIPG